MFPSWPNADPAPNRRVETHLSPGGAPRVNEVEHPSYAPGSLAVPAPPLPALEYPPEPAFVPAEKLGPLAGKKKLAAAEKAQTQHEERVRQWHARCQTMYTDYLAAQETWRRKDAERVERLAAAKATYDAECRQREVDAEAHNQQLTELINGLAFDVEDAISEYVGIVLSNSAYPASFAVIHDHDFDLATRELTLRVTVPEPTGVPSVKEYKYVKAKDEITSTSLTAKAQKDRYSSAVWQVAVRSVHEVFEADRAGKIHSVALTVAVDRVAPATGLPETIPLVVVAAERETFNAFDLSGVVPEATLAHLGAAMSKSPFDYAPATAGRGVRARGQQ